LEKSASLGILILSPDLPLIPRVDQRHDKRNIAAHPSSVVVVQSQADDVVTDLINNVVLALT
jgi:hypothetical protein